MEAKKLSVGTAYATCNGQYVVPQDLKKRYRWKYNPDKKKDELIELGPDGRVDPWSDCHVTRDRGGGKRTGLKVHVFEVDRDGKPTGKGKVDVVPPRDIRGTWDDYLLLYAHTIQREADRRTERERAERVRVECRTRLQTKFKGADVWMINREDYQTKKSWWEFEIRLPRVLEGKMDQRLKELGV